MKRISIILLLTLAASSMQAQRIKGSDTVLPVAQQTAERFMALNPDARITVTGGGTGVGISALLDGTTDIAMASRPSSSARNESKVRRQGSRRSNRRLRCPRRRGTPFQPRETTDTPTTGRYLPGKNNKLEASGWR